MRPLRNGAFFPGASRAESDWRFFSTWTRHVRPVPRNNLWIWYRVSAIQPSVTNRPDAAVGMAKVTDTVLSLLLLLAAVLL
jgi:hypothetical protein